MKKNLLFYVVLLMIPFISFMLLSYSNGAPFDGVTGSPGDGGVSCTSCHNIIDNYGTTIAISSNIPSNGFELGKTYQITVTLTANSIAAKFGFQITAEDTSNAKVGSFSLTETNNTKVDVAGHFVTQPQVQLKKLGILIGPHLQPLPVILNFTLLAYQQMLPVI